MAFSTKLSTLAHRIRCWLQDRLSHLQDRFAAMICLLLLGFLVGNLFSTLVCTIRRFVLWDGFVVLSLIVGMEGINWARYRSRARSLFCGLPLLPRMRPPFWHLVNMFKTGLMIGFFVDAFKVGS